MSCARSLLPILALVILAGFSSQQRLMASQYIPGMESVLRAIDERYGRGGPSPIQWPGFGQGPVPDGFYMGQSDGLIQQVAQSAVANLLSASAIFIQNDSAMEDQPWGGANIPSLWSTLQPSAPASEASPYAKLLWCVTQLPKFRHFEASVGPGEGRYWQKSDSKVVPLFDPNQETHINTGWVSVPDGSGAQPQFMAGTTHVEYWTEDGHQYFSMMKSQGATISCTKFKVYTNAGLKGVSVKVFVALTEAGQTAYAGQIPADGKMHKAASGSGSGVALTDFFPSGGPTYAPFAPLQFLNGVRQSSNSMGFNYLGARAIASATFDPASISPPICIPEPGMCCPKNSAPNASGGGTPEANTPNKSIIHNPSRTYFHSATDFQIATASSGGCGPCGGASAPGDDALESFRLVRRHRYADLGWHGSFGPGVYSNYDFQLRVHTTGKRLDLFDPSLSSAIPIAFDNASGTFIDKTYQSIREVTFHRFNGGPTITALDQATIAVLTTVDARRYVFDLFPETDGVGDLLAGRLTAIIDRNDNRTTLAYLDTNPRVGDAQLQYDRQRLWRIGSVTDAYGKQAALSWTRSCGQWVISAVTAVGSGVIFYDYDLGNLIGLGRVRYPDGTISTFSTTWDATTLHQQVAIADAGAEGIHRNKTVFFTTCRRLSFGDQITEPQPANRIWQLLNGSGEVSYRNQLSGGADGWGLDVYEGGGSGTGMVKHLEFDDQGRLLTQTRAKEFTLTATRIEVSGYQPVATFTPDVASRVTQQQDTATGERKVYSRNGVGYPTAVVYQAPDNTVRSNETTTYNPFQQPLVHTDRLGRVTEKQYDPKGNLLATIAAKATPVQATTQRTYNSRGQPLTSTDANGNTTTFVYDETPGSLNYRRLVAMVEPADVVGGPQATTTFTYDAAGRLATVTDPENRVVTRTYDGRNRLTRITYHDATYEEWTYGGGVDANLAITHKDRNGNTETSAYDGSGRRTTLTIANPASVLAGQSAWTYLPGSDVTATEAVNGDITTYTYDGQMRRVAVARKANTGTILTTRTAYRDDGRVDYEEDAYGRRAYQLYDHNNQPIRLVRELVPGGASVPEDTLANRDDYLIALSRLTTANPAYVIEDAAFDEESQQVARTDARGVVSTMEYDEQGRLDAQVEAATDTATVPATIVAYAARTEYGYDPQGNRTSVIHPRSFTRNPTTGAFTLVAMPFVTVSTYTGRNLLKSVTEASGTTDAATVNFTYTLTKQKATQSDPRNPAWLTTFTYYTCCNRLYQVIDPLTFATTYTYDANGNVLTVRDANNTGVTKTYDARNRPLMVTNTDNETTIYTYDDNLSDAVGLSNTYAAKLAGLAFGAGADGSAVEIRNHLSETMLEIRDGVGRVVRRVDGNGNATSVVHDGLLNGLVVTTVTDALGNSTVTRTDAAGRVREALDAAAKLSTGTFDANGNQLTARDPNNVGWTATYDLRNRRLTTTDTHGDGTANTYDLHGNVLTARDALLKTHTCTYDYRDRKVTCTDRLTAAGVTTHAYDKANHLVQIVDADSASGVTDYTYDARGKLTSETFPAGKDGKRTVRTYAYDNGGRLLSRTMTTAPAASPALNEATTYGYDPANRLTGRTYNDGLGNDSFTYDDAGRLLTAVSGRYGSTVSRGYTGNTPAEKGGRLTSEQLTLTGANAGTWTVNYQYDAANRLADLTYPTGEAQRVEPRL